jgi:uncharacterized protein YjdB/glycosidase
MKRSFNLMARVKTASAIFCLLALLLANSVFAQDPAQYGTPFTGVPDPRDANIYQVNARLYDASNRKLSGVTAKLDNIKALGVNVIYLMPIYPIGVTKASGSPYAISDLKGIASDLGTLTDLRALVDGAHNRGMAVILDWVVNQTSWDHPWLTQHKDWYKQDGSGNVLSPTPDGSFFFTDCAALDMNNTTMRAAMIDAMRYWIFAANVDGFRCDWADNPPKTFWDNTISNLRGITSHKLLMLAEGSNEGTTTGCNTCGQNQPGYHYQSGFDFIFGEGFYWNFMKKVYNSGESAATDLTAVTNGEYSGASATQLVARYLSNHDEYGSDGSPFSWLSGGRNAVMSAFVIGAYYRGVPFIYNGIEVGNTSALTYPWNSQTINWTQDLTVLTEMKKLLAFRNASTALRRGTPTSYTTTDVVAFTKINGSEKVVAMINTRNASKTFTIPAAMAGTYVDAFTNASVTLTSGATQTLNAFQYIVLTNASVPVVAVTGVSVSPTSASVKAGLQVQLSASVAPSNATNQAVTWTSSNTGIATVDANGLVTGVAAGTATITVKTNDGNKTATSAITVTPASTFTVHYYNSLNWAAVDIYWWSALPSGVLADGTWPGVATTSEGNGWFKYTFTNVSSTNLIFNNAQTSGGQTADLNRAGTDGWYYNGAWYNTQPATIAVTSVTVSPTSATVAVGATSQLTATVNPSNATNKTVTWSSSNTNVASVSAVGLVTGVGAGTATVTVTTQDGSKTATCAITVPTPPATYYYIKNRWQNTYLYDAGANVGYSTATSGNNYKWSKVLNSDGSGYFYIKNLGTGQYMHIEPNDGTVRCDAGNLANWSQQWAQEDVDATWKRFRSRWNPSGVTLKINVENQTGFAQDGIVQDGWFSAQWQLVTTTGRLATEEVAEEEKVLSVEVFPNPSNSKQFNIVVTGLQRNESASVTVHDVNGNIALQKQISEPTRVEHNLPAGLYLLNVRAHGKNAFKKVIVE